MDAPPDFVVSLTVDNPAEALAFYESAFGAKETFRLPMPDGSIGHAEFKIGSTLLMLSGAYPAWNAAPMPADATASCLFGITAEDVDAAFQRALDAGATAIDAPADQFWGARTAVVRDPYGYRWNIRKMTEDLSPDEIMARLAAMAGGAPE